MYNINEDTILYAGDIVSDSRVNHKYKNTIGISLNRQDNRHIKHDLTKPIPLDDNLVKYFQAEDVFEHIEFDKLHDTIKEIYRILKPNGIFRLSVPDYKWEHHINRSVKDEKGNIIFDPVGGGSYDENSKTVIGGGHVWFPTIESVKELFDNSPFKTNGEINYLHYFDEDGIPVLNEIDYSIFYVMRTPDNFKRYEQYLNVPHSIVVDAIKK